MVLMGTKLVIVDDAPFIREVIKNVFLKTDIEVVGEAEDGEEAVKVALEVNPDVVLMDMVMPKKNGIDATQEILAKRPTTKIVACSTADQEMVLVEALEAGCCSFLVKPFNAKSLEKAIRDAVK